MTSKNVRRQHVKTSPIRLSSSQRNPKHNGGRPKRCTHKYDPRGFAGQKFLNLRLALVPHRHAAAHRWSQATRRLSEVDNAGNLRGCTTLRKGRRLLATERDDTGGESITARVRPCARISNSRRNIFFVVKDRVWHTVYPSFGRKRHRSVRGRPLKAKQPTRRRRGVTRKKH